MYLFCVALDDGLYGLYLGEVCEMAKLLTYKHLGICGYGRDIVASHGDGTTYGDTCC